MSWSRGLSAVLWLDVLYFVILGGLMILVPKFVNDAFKVPTYSAVDLRALGVSLFGWGAISYVALREPQTPRRLIRTGAALRVLGALVLLAASTVLAEAPFAQFVVAVIISGGLGVLEFSLS